MLSTGYTAWYWNPVAGYQGVIALSTLGSTIRSVKANVARRQAHAKTNPKVNVPDDSGVLSHV